MGAESEMLLAGHRLMLASDFGGTITWAGNNYPAVIGSFDVQQNLSPDGGGFSPSVTGLITVARMDLPADFAGFKRGQTIISTPDDTTRPQRTCRVFDTRDCGALIELAVNDVNQGA